MNKSTKLSPDRVMIHTPTLTTRGGEIIQISYGIIQLRETQYQGNTIKLNLAGCPTNHHQHTSLHSSNIKLPHHHSEQNLMKIEC
jgi:hypothetical protein